MKLTTLRNLMASMLVLGVAGSVIAVGNGTFALFNATTTNTGNTFTTDDLTFSNTPNGGAACTATASTTPSQPSCNFLVKITGSTTVPGDSKLGLLTLNNGSAQVDFNVSLGVTAPVTSSVLDQTPAASSATSGLGLLIFRCTAADNTTTQACSTAATHLVALYGGCTAVPSIASGGVIATTFGSARAADNQIPAGDGGTALCTAGNTGAGAGISTVTVPTSALGLATLGDGTKGLIHGGTDNLAVVVYLPGIAADSVAAKASNLSFTWTATQVVGGPR